MRKLNTKPKKPTKKNQYVVENQGCDNAFNQPRVARLLEKITIEYRLFADKPYQAMVLKHKNTGLENQLVILPETFANAEHYQQKVKKQIEGTLYYRLDLADGNNPSDETVKESIIYWDENWLTIRQVGDEYSGGAHPNFWETFTTFNAQTGQEENLWNWLKNVKVETHHYDGTVYKTYHPSSAFLKLLKQFDNFTVCKKIFSEDKVGDIANYACLEPKKLTTPNDSSDPTYNVEEDMLYDSLSLALHPKGLIVRIVNTAGSGSGSYNNLIPYKNILPYLNQKGREHVEQMMLNQSVQVIATKKAKT